MENYKAKFMCSYGGSIQPRPHDNRLSYVGGHTKILTVHRTIKFPAMLAELSSLCAAASLSSFEYQLPGEDLDTLISVTDDNDLDNMMLEYDQLHRASATPARMRLFLFPNSGPASVQPDPFKPNPNVDFHFSLDKGVVVPPPHAAPKFHYPVPEHVAPPPEYQPRVSVDTADRVVVPDPNMNQPLEVQWQLQRVVDRASSSSSSSSRCVGPLTRRRYDVFISFRGEDTRTNFTSHLHEALSHKQIKTFIDYEIHKGDAISPSLSEAIVDSYVSVVVFSENYASSRWCLEELVEIVECRRKQGQSVIPVFYNTDPSQVRHQIGSYKKAFEKHMQKPTLHANKIQNWRDALEEAADLSGWDSRSRSYRDDSELIQKIVQDVLQKLNFHYPPNDFSKLGLVGKNHVLVESLLREARSLGIWGMGGAGKTTIAKYIFDKYSHQYEGSCFLENVRERSGERGQWLHSIRSQLHSELLRNKNGRNSTFDEHRLQRQRNLIVLDDVSSSQQLEWLVGELHSCGPSSRIIITGRDKNVLENRRVEKIFEVEALDFHESLELFSLNAFNEKSPQTGYIELSRRAVDYCKGLPLGLKLLGSFLHRKSEIEWDSALKKLEKLPMEDIQKVLRLSYDGLDDEEKDIFLDIACFFKEEWKKHVIDVIDSYGHHAVSSMRSLHDRALIDICGDFVGMHDLIQQMGWEIVRKESIKNPGSRSRLWVFDDICDVLKNNKGTDSIEGIVLDMSHSRQNLCLNADTFKKMPNLRYLKFFISSHQHGRLCLELPMGLESFSDKLRYFEWHECPLQSLPSNFCAEKLVTLRMLDGQFKRLWDGVQNLVNLKKVDLQDCAELTELPDFSKAKKLEIVDLSRCTSLRHVHPSISSLPNLESLDITKCTKLETLESEIHSRSLRNLIAWDCSSLINFSLSSEEMTHLCLSNTGIKELHLSIGCSSKIIGIYLDGARLENLPKGFSCLKSLKFLWLSGPIVSKQNLCVIFDGLQCLLELHLKDCLNLSELPDNVSCLSSLLELVLDGSHVERLSEGIKHLSKLKTLSLKGCRMLQSLPELPSSICDLRANNCILLQKVVAFSPRIPGPQEQNRIYISFQNCVSLDVEKCIVSFLQCARELVCGYELGRRGAEEEEKEEEKEEEGEGGEGVEEEEGEGGEGVEEEEEEQQQQQKLVYNICYPDYRIPEWFTYRKRGASITLALLSYQRCIGSLLCVVLSPFTLLSLKSDGFDIACRCYLEDGNMDGHSTGWHAINYITEDLNEYRVYISYFNFDSFWKRVNHHSASNSDNPKVSFEFYVREERDVSTIDYDIYEYDSMIIECGVYPLDAPDYLN